jgi:hypothetical protein
MAVSQFSVSNSTRVGRNQKTVRDFCVIFLSQDEIKHCDLLFGSTRIKKRVASKGKILDPENGGFMEDCTQKLLIIGSDRQVSIAGWLFLVFSLSC